MRLRPPWGKIAVQHLLDASKGGAYAAAAEQSADRLAKRYMGGGRKTKPEVIAKCIAKAVTAKHPRTRYLLGYGAKPMVGIQRVLGDRVYDKLTQMIL